MIATFIDAHPVVFTVLALPVVLTLCVLFLALMRVNVTWRLPR